jgi:hypothetical protein
MDRLEGKNVLVVDEVDDTRRTLVYVNQKRSNVVRYCVDELKKHNVAGVGCLVIHNKLKEKNAQFTEDVKYFSGEDIEDLWVCVDPQLSLLTLVYRLSILGKPLKLMPTPLCVPNKQSYNKDGSLLLELEATCNRNFSNNRFFIAN